MRENKQKTVEEDTMLEQICRRVGMSVLEFMCSFRYAGLCDKRRGVMWYLNKKLGYSFQEIADMSLRNRTSVYYNVTRVEQLIAIKDRATMNVMRKLEIQLGNK